MTNLSSGPLSTKPLAKLQILATNHTRIIHNRLDLIPLGFAAVFDITLLMCVHFCGVSPSLKWRGESMNTTYRHDCLSCLQSGRISVLKMCLIALWKHRLGFGFGVVVFNFCKNINLVLFWIPSVRLGRCSKRFPFILNTDDTPTFNLPA